MPEQTLQPPLRPEIPQALEKKKMNVLAAGKKEEPGQKAMVDVVSQINDVSRRLIILEERFSNIRKKMQVSDQNMLSQNQKVSNELKLMNLELSEIKKDINEMKIKSDIIVKELRQCAKKDEVEVLQKYINLWEPIKFVTQNEVERIVKRMIEENK